MNIKSIFGVLLTLPGIIGFLCTAYLFVNTSSQTRDIKSLIICGILGIVFFLSEISLIRVTKDES